MRTTHAESIVIFCVVTTVRAAAHTLREMVASHAPETPVE
jgi:hypothetical protein